MKKSLALFLILSFGILQAGEGSKEQKCPPRKSTWEGFTAVDFLYWYARESDLSYALETEIGAKNPANDPSSQILFPKTFKYLNANWDPGFRLGLGFSPDYDDWDITSSWTYFKNKSQKSRSLPPIDISGTSISLIGTSFFINPWMNVGFEGPAAGLESTGGAVFFNQAIATWKLFFNSIDLELGKKYWFSKRFLFRPYTGLRGAWTRSRFNSYMQFQSLNETEIYQSNNRFRNSYWGLGFLGGFQPSWYMTRNLSLYANLDGALIWGEMRAKKREIDFEQIDARDVIEVPVNADSSISAHFFKMQAILDLALGLRWEGSWKCDRFKYAASLGWEHHIWFNHNVRYKYSSPVSSAISVMSANIVGIVQYEESFSDLTFGGLVLRALVNY